MQAGVAPRAQERAVKRLVTHLSALDRLMREPEVAGLARLETRLGRDLAVRALRVAHDGVALW